MRLTPYLYFRGDCESALNFDENCGLAGFSRSDDMKERR